jgi:hypothetical protein
MPIKALIQNPDGLRPGINQGCHPFPLVRACFPLIETRHQPAVSLRCSFVLMFNYSIVLFFQGCHPFPLVRACFPLIETRHQPAVSLRCSIVQL